MPGEMRINPTARNYSAIAKDLRSQFAGKSEHAGIRGDAEGLYVKDSNRIWDKLGGGQERKGVRQQKFQRAIDQLAAAVDRQYPDVRIGGEKLSEYAFGHLLAEDAYHRLDKASFIALDDIINETVANWNKEPAPPAPRNEAVNSANGGFRHSSGRRDLEGGCNAIRQAIAMDLEFSSGGMGIKSDSRHRGDLPQSGDESFLKKADEIIENLGIAKTGLTREAIDKVRTHLLTDPAYNVPNADGKYPEFVKTQGLYDCLAAANSVDLNMQRLADFTLKLNDQIAQLRQSRPELGEKLDAVEHTLGEAWNTLDVLVSDKWGIVSDTPSQAPMDDALESRAMIAAQELLATVQDMYEHVYRKDDLPPAANLQGLNGPQASQDALNETMRGFANAAHDMARFLLPKAGRDLARLDVRDPAVSANGGSELYQDWALHAFALNRPLAVQFRTQNALYQGGAVSSGDQGSRFERIPEHYSSTLSNFRQAYTAYLAAPEEQKNFDQMRERLDDAMAANHAFRAHMNKLGLIGAPLPQQRAFDIQNLLEAQTRDLETFSFAVEAERARRESDAPVQSGANVIGGDNVEDSVLTEIHDEIDDQDLDDEFYSNLIKYLANLGVKVEDDEPIREKDARKIINEILEQRSNAGVSNKRDSLLSADRDQSASTNAVGGLIPRNAGNSPDDILSLRKAIVDELRQSVQRRAKPSEE